MEEIEYKIWFSKLKISNKIKLKLLNDFGDIKNIWNANSEMLKNKEYLRNHNCEYIRYFYKKKFRK